MTATITPLMVFSTVIDDDNDEGDDNHDDEYHWC